MEDIIECPKCHKPNAIDKFCRFCGKKLLDDEEIKLILDNPEPYCLNCGRPVKQDQAKCECGYRLADIKCPDCEANNRYTNKFCTSCGKKLWKNTPYYYKYTGRLFEHHLFSPRVPYTLRNISVFKRYMDQSGWFDENTYHYDDDLEKLQSEDSDIDKNLYEICSRWRIVSPNNCISCLKISSDVCGCMYPFLTDNKRIEFLQNEKNYYVKPTFDDEELKWTSKYKKRTYLCSLAPAIGESQLEYRERLKWDFAANLNRKKKIKNIINSINIIDEWNSKFSKPKTNTTVNTASKGKCCDNNCIHIREEYVDYDGDGDYYNDCEYYCALGRSEVDNGRFCEYYKS